MYKLIVCSGSVPERSDNDMILSETLHCQLQNNWGVPDSQCGSVAERSKESNSGSNGCEFEPRARTSVLR